MPQKEKKKNGRGLPTEATAAIRWGRRRRRPNDGTSVATRHEGLGSRGARARCFCADAVAAWSPHPTTPGPHPATGFFKGTGSAGHSAAGTRLWAAAGGEEGERGKAARAQRGQRAARAPSCYPTHRPNARPTGGPVRARPFVGDLAIVTSIAPVPSRPSPDIDSRSGLAALWTGGESAYATVGKGRAHTHYPNGWACAVALAICATSTEGTV